MKLQYPTICHECKQVMRAGEEATWLGVPGAYMHSDCPKRKDPRPPGQHTPSDAEGLFQIRKCSVCGQVWCFKDSLLISRCPALSFKRKGRCNGKWLRGDPEQTGWAA